ncbi:winged helix-turn-helix transcriptional regulator [Actinotalea sp. BY-33]|uniref:Winged helix-turn-helix transcriptional regulator n=1 Tax=Actinotalea soli TaxID=2819234 RepID=A0A939RVV3_9CELL|nr:winged helix-turn-helix domain-containing protein [Actinotalea soli]MBO1752770.1 winged helix-turn-helix transcriptional regulator [Actinotalea soli]
MPDVEDGPPAEIPPERAAEVPEASEREADADARALASVLRMRILRLCLDQALTNKEIAERLGRRPATTFHHVRTLAERGFLAAQPERRGARGAREIPYRATGKSWRMPRVPGTTRVLIDTFLSEVAELDDPDAMVVSRLGLRLDEAGYAELHRRLSELLQDLADRPGDPGGTPYSIFLAVHEDVARRET